MTQANTKATLLNNLRTQRNHWETLVTKLNPDQLAAPVLPDQYSIKDIIAHLTAWQRLTVARLEAALKDETPGPTEWPQHLDEDHQVDQINEWIYQTYHPTPLPDILREWRRVFGRVLELGEALPEKTLAQPYPWLSGAPLSAVLLGSYEHYDEHLTILRQWLARNKI